MALDPAALPDLLRLEPAGDGRYFGPHESHDNPAHTVVFGGQILAQMIMATAYAHDDDGSDAGGKVVKSIHTLFARPGDTRAPIEYTVDTMQDGRTFGSDTVTCLQGGKVLARGLVLRTVVEPDLVRHTSVAMPTVSGPDDPSGRADGRVFPGAVGIVADGVDTISADAPAAPAVQRVWTRYEHAVASPVANQAILSWATDGYLIGTAMLPHEGIGESLAHRTLSTGVVGHTVNFHDPVDVSQWLLLDNESVWAGHGRAYGRCNVFTADGRLVANYTQDSMLRGMGEVPPRTDGRRAM